jgi:L-iditol 2-dehydrogenase
MKALQITAPGHVSEINTPSPEITHPNEVKVTIQAAAVSNQHDRNIFLDRSSRRGKCSYPCPPGFPGREGTGVVTAAGKDVQTLQPGDRVLLCRWSGNLYQESIVCPEQWAKKAVTEAKAAALAPADLMAGMLALLKRAEKVFRAACVVIGLGPAGQAAVMWLRVLGARQIWAIEKNQLCREKGLELGADYVFSPRDTKGINELRGLGPETVVECSGTHSGMALSFDLASKDALLFGRNEHPFEIVQADWAEKNLAIKNQSGFDRPIWDETADYINRSFIAPGRLVSRILPFSADNYMVALNMLQSPAMFRIVMSFE